MSHSPTQDKLNAILENQSESTHRLEAYQDALRSHEKQENTIFAHIETSIRNIEGLLSHMQEDIETHRTMLDVQRRRIELITLYLVAATVCAIVLTLRIFA